MNHLQIVKENSIKCQELKSIDYNYECLVFDTESCRKEVNNNKSAKVYGWGIGCTRSNKMIYGQDLNQFFDTCKWLFKDYCNKNKNLLKVVKTKEKGKEKGYPSHKYIKLPMGVHNLVWDCEFLKYGLHECGFNYLMGDVVDSKTSKHQSLKVNEIENTFHIVQNEGIVYGCEIYFPFSTYVINKDGSQTNFGLCLDIFDTYKIITAPEKNFHNYTQGINEMFHKMEEVYDYDSVRPLGHIQTDLELRYQYNDIYMLKECLQQFYIDRLMEGHFPKKGGCRTASSIAFKKLKKMTFGDTQTDKKYREYFELDFKTTFETCRIAMENDSYGGGYTHANYKFIDVVLPVFGHSLDINSSYPSQMAYEVFPYGKPSKSEFGVIPDIDKETQVFLVQIGFDFVKPKCKEYDLPVFKIGANNIKRLSKIVGDISSQEYFSTNITKEGEIIVVEKTIGDNKVSTLHDNFLSTKYNMVVTNHEYDFFVKHFDFGVLERNELGFPKTSVNFKYDIKDNSFNGLDIGNVLIYKAERGKFKPFVDYFTEMKVEAKKDNPIVANQAKLFLNSSYGKFGTKTEKVEQDMILDKNGIWVFTSEGEKTYNSQEFYKPYASFVTSYGRLMLWNTIIHCVGVENFLYTDTDSIYFQGELERVENNLKKIGKKVHPTELGAWDKEHTFIKFKMLGQKKYMYEAYTYDKKTKKITGTELIMKCCGLPQVAREQLCSNKWDIVATTRHKVVRVKRGKIIKKKKEPFNEFRLGKEVTGKLQKRRVVGGALLLNTVYKIKKVAW